MLNLLDQIQSIDNRIAEVALAPPQGFITVEPRKVRRVKACNTAKASQTTRSRAVQIDSIKQN
jgi:hypothetical protein